MGPVEFETLKGTSWQLKESRAVVARQPMLAGGGAIPHPIIPEIAVWDTRRMSREFSLLTEHQMVSVTA